MTRLLLLSLVLGQSVPPGVAVRNRAPSQGDYGLVVRPVGSTQVGSADGGPVPIQFQARSESAFGTLLAVPETMVASLSFAYNTLNTDYVSTDAGGGATITADGGKAILSVYDGGSDSAELTSRNTVRYVPGQGVAARFTFVSSGCVYGQLQEVGIGNDSDGFFFGCQPDAGFGVLRRSGGTDNWVPRAQWNGEWPSDAGIDITKGYPYQIAYQWLGYGQVAFFVENPATGLFQPAHYIKYAGTSAETSILNPSLPLRARISNAFGSSTAGTLQVPSMGAIRQGSELGVTTPSLGLRKAVANTRTVNTSGVPILTIRNNASFNGVQNRVRVHIDYISWSTAAQDTTLRVLLNASLSTPAYRNVNAATSVTAYDIDAGASVSGGTELVSFVGQANTSQSEYLRDMEVYLQPGETLTITGTSDSATPATRVAVSWVEQF